MCWHVLPKARQDAFKQHGKWAAVSDARTVFWYRCIGTRTVPAAIVGLAQALQYCGLEPWSAFVSSFVARLGLGTMAEQQGSSPMFAIFVLSLLSLALFPYTIYRFCNTGDAEEVVKPWQVLRRSMSCALMCHL